MNIFSNGTLNNHISSFNIDDFNIHKTLSDIKKFKEIVAALLIQPTYKKIFFQFRREENLFLEEKDLRKYRVEIPEYFNTYGEYLVVRRIDDSRFDSFGLLPNNQQTVDYIPTLWNYFYSCDFFITSSDLSLEYLKDHWVDLMDDIDGLKLFQKKMIDLICIKGLGGDYMTINYSNSYNLPNFLDLIN